MTEPNWFEDVFAAARLIPAGVVKSYGQLGDRAGVTARMAGKAMSWASDAPGLDAVPWWRVLGADGTLRIGKRDPLLAKLQRERLEAEGVKFTGWARPGEAGSLARAGLDYARAVARRAERSMLALHESGELVPEVVRLFFNRLSDLLWILARSSVA